VEGGLKLYDLQGRFQPKAFYNSMNILASFIHFWLCYFFPLLPLCGIESHGLFMHYMKNYFLRSDLNFLSFSFIHCPLSCVLGNMENKSSQHIFSRVFIIFLVIALLADVLLEGNNPFLFSSSQMAFSSSFP